MPLTSGRSKTTVEKPLAAFNFCTFTVATPNKAPAANTAEPPLPSFEEAMSRLDAIVEAMESGDVPLADLLAKFEEGSRLLTHCENRLQAAELRIEQLKRQKDGQFTTEAFEAAPRTSAH